MQQAEPFVRYARLEDACAIAAIFPMVEQFVQ
jgi:hypothetical protein